MGHTLKRVTFKEKSNSEVIIISRTDEVNAVYPCNEMLSCTLLDILETYKKLAIQKIKSYILDFHLYCLSGELCKKLQMVVRADEVNIFLTVQHTTIQPDGSVQTDVSSFKEIHSGDRLLPVLVGLINIDIQAL